MKSCVFLGHRVKKTKSYRDSMLLVIKELIENKGVTLFYSTYFSDFDTFCCELLFELKTKYPQIEIIQVHRPDPTLNVEYDDWYFLQRGFDDDLNLIEKGAPRRYTVFKIDKYIVDKADYIVAGELQCHNSALAACYYAHKKKKPVISVIDGFKIN